MLVALNYKVKIRAHALQLSFNFISPAQLAKFPLYPSKNGSYKISCQLFEKHGDWSLLQAEEIQPLVIKK